MHINIRKATFILLTVLINRIHMGEFHKFAFLNIYMCLLLESNQLTEMSTKLVDNLNQTNSSQNEDYDKISVSIYRKTILITSEELKLRATKNVQVHKNIEIVGHDNKL